MRRLLLSLPLLLLTLASCDLLGDDEGEERERELMPLAVGNYWAYSSWYLQEALSDSFQVVVTREVTITEGGSPHQAFAWSYRFGESQEPLEWLYRNDQDGLRVAGGVTDTDTLVLDHAALEYKYPAEVGEAWPSVRLGYRSDEGIVVVDTIVVSLIATDEPFDTPLGTFTCYVYRFSFSPAEDVAASWNVYRYYVPGVGNVGEVIRSQIPGETESMDVTAKSVLYDYRVN